MIYMWTICKCLNNDTPPPSTPANNTVFRHSSPDLTKPTFEVKHKFETSRA